METRLAILICLSDAPEYTATDGILHGYLVGIGLGESYDAIRSHLAWLDEQGLVIRQTAGGQLGMTLATLTQAGQDVSAGRSQVPGVARPRPRSGI
ncbi:MAG: helix-turn-helix transcriptional regulator [Candidatus Accumulibacter sp.]|uniref:VpaChn25_0724 family phage protein n=1 Tax=Accumulibacter sp. TaxID=2053492 RepID=UPI001A54AF16|nr:helix-turn-helix transcriptional regulator [Accumulibacter sp.]MBL8396136.1 helix-turn-helix transcriptional regulator [Accumulibacter sp.]